MKVAVLNEISNSKTGYSISISSTNLGKLKRTNGPEVFAYSMKYNGSNVNLSTASGSVFSRAKARVSNVNGNITISYTGKAPETITEGVYADTITFGITTI